MRALRVLVLVVLGSLLASGPLWAAPKTIDGVVNINSASVAELQRLPGIGPAKAERIVAYRKARPFRTVEELGRVKGIGPKTVRKLKPHLSVKGDTTIGSAPAAVPAPPAPTAPTP